MIKGNAKHGIEFGAEEGGADVGVEADKEFLCLLEVLVSIGNA